MLACLLSVSQSTHDTASPFAFPRLYLIRKSTAFDVHRSFTLTSHPTIPCKLTNGHAFNPHAVARGEVSMLYIYALVPRCWSMCIRTQRSGADCFVLQQSAMSSLVRSFGSLYSQKLRSTTRLGSATAAPPRFQALVRSGFSGSSHGGDVRRPPARPSQHQSQDKERTPFFILWLLDCSVRCTVISGSRCGS